MNIDQWTHMWENIATSTIMNERSRFEASEHLESTPCLQPSMTDIDS
jgi:hypothetical protein